MGANAAPAADTWWQAPLRDAFGGRDIVLVGAVPAAWTDHVRHLEHAGAGRVMVVATDGPGVGPGPDVETHVIDVPAELGMMERIRRANRLIADPPAGIRTAVDEFDPGHVSVVIGSFLNESPTFGDRPLLAHRRPEWVALEDKTTVDAFWKAAGVPHQPSAVVAIGDAAGAAAALDRGDGTVWAGDAREGFHGGGHLTRWVHDGDSERRARADLGVHCDAVRVMPFVEGVPCSIHAVVLPDGDAVLRPVEMVTLRHAGGFLYAGCATFWDPPAHIREQMRSAARRAAAHLRTTVGFRGTFTLDGVAARDGFWPTELNPRYGAGINVIARAVGDIPILLLHDLAVAGVPVGIDAPGFERTLVEAADRRRGGGTWLVDRPTHVVASRTLSYDGSTWHPAAADRPGDGELVAGANFARCAFDPERTERGASVAPRAAALWNALGRELGAGLGDADVRPAVDPFTASSDHAVAAVRE
jgi:hypothetical protein